MENIFIETADNEKEQAKRFYKFLLEGLEGDLPATIEINAGYPVAQGNTLENLKAAANGENEEWSELYPYLLMLRTKVFRNRYGFRRIADAEKDMKFDLIN